MRTATSSLLRFVIVGFGCATSACSSTTTNGAANSGTIAATYANAYCDYYERCNPFAIRSAYGDVAKCKSTLAITTEITVGAKGTAVAQSQMDACAATMQTIGCEEIVEARPECRFKGTLADGASCASSVQCASSSCFHKITDLQSSDCGTCVAEVGDGADCTNTNCLPELFCANNKCVAPAAEGADCGEAKPCGAVLDCIGGKCARPLPAGAPCELSETAPLCDIFKGFNCVPSSAQTATGTCREINLAAVGEGCGFDAATSVLTACVAATCTNLLEAGKCEAYLPEGTACSADTASCTPGTACKNGQCRKPNPSQCD